MRIWHPGRTLLVLPRIRMNIIKKLKYHRKHSAKKETSISSISISDLTGISALPTEIWSLILTNIVTSHLGDPRLQCNEIQTILQYRLVCQIFSKETLHALHTHIHIPHLPSLALIRTLNPHNRITPSPSPSSSENTLIYSLLANSIRNTYTAYTALSPFRQKRVARRVPAIVHRVRNCIVLAQRLDHISPPISTSLPNVTFLTHLCTLASTSVYVHEYIFLPWKFYPGFTTCGQGDAYLEAALLVACGYEIRQVVGAKVELMREGKADKYRVCNVEYHGWTGARNRWWVEGPYGMRRRMAYRRCQEGTGTWEGEWGRNGRIPTCGNET
ncbi:hypothetical protein FB567DRAFT_519979 [Paraphoma chrysanthemicola]|uniref:Uncharacterized protein n=1 Tax=Paraphoma chrysanthemicola TaxID=798071 RepID=A0A8K0RDT1_9PLEO|nr:hypothetical protein FB567DRAFT_519979 [Paraphoma chrysanthemicola]